MIEVAGDLGTGRKVDTVIVVTAAEIFHQAYLGNHHITRCKYIASDAVVAKHHKGVDGGEGVARWVGCAQWVCLKEGVACQWGHRKKRCRSAA